MCLVTVGGIPSLVVRRCRNMTSDVAVTPESCAENNLFFGNGCFQKKKIGATKLDNLPRLTTRSLGRRMQTRELSGVRVPLYSIIV